MYWTCFKQQETGKLKNNFFRKVMINMTYLAMTTIQFRLNYDDLSMNFIEIGLK